MSPSPAVAIYFWQALVNRSIYIFDTMTGEEVVRFKASASVTSIAFLEPNHGFSESHDFMDANSEG